MAYDKAELFAKALELAKDTELKLIWIEEVIAYMGISKSTFYAYFPADSDEMHAIKDAIQVNKISQKVKQRNKWYASDNPTMQLALYRLLSTPEEHQLLNQNTIELRTPGEGEEIQLETEE